MKITFIYPDIIGSANYRGYFYTGIGYLSSVLKKEKHDVSFIHITQPIEKEKLISDIKALSPDVIGFSTTTNMFEFVKTWAKWIKEQMNVLIVCGGVHCILNPEEVISEKHIDIICVGEGEETLIDLCDAMTKNQEFFNIRNLWIKNNGKVYRNPCRPLIKNLDVLPFPDRTIYDNYPNLYHEREGRAVIMASRGCPYNCTYCCNLSLKQKFNGLGQYVRFRSPDNVIAEIKETIANYAFIKSIAFDDDILPLRKEWLNEFSNKYADEISLPFSCNIHPFLINSDVIQMLKHSGCTELHIGIESGNEQIRNNILNRKISNEHILQALSLCRKHNLRVYTYNLVGLPFEGTKEMLDTVKINVKYSDINQVSIFFPYKGTKLYNICLEQGLLSSKIVFDYFKDTMLNYPRSKRNRIIFIKNYFRILVKLYSVLDKLPKIITKIIDALLCSKIFSVLFFYPANKLIHIFYKYKGLYKLARSFKRKFIDR